MTGLMMPLISPTSTGGPAAGAGCAVAGLAASRTPARPTRPISQPRPRRCLSWRRGSEPGWPRRREASGDPRRSWCRRWLGGGARLTITAQAARGAQQRLQQLDRDREDDGRVLVGGDLGQGLQVAQLQRGWLAADQLGGGGQLLRAAELALGVDDLSPLLALGLGLAGHGPPDRLRQVVVAHLRPGLP